MKNPIIQNWKSLLLYTLYWCFLAVVVGVLGFFYFKTPFIKCLVDAVLWFFPVGFLLAILWYPIKFFNLRFMSPQMIVLNHTGILAGVIGLWLFIGTRLSAWIGADPQLLPFKLTFGIFSYFVFVMFVYLYEFYQQNLQAQKDQQRLVSNLKETELSLLKNQLNPHFLFNSLNSLNALIGIDATKAREMVVKLSDLMRFNLNHSKLHLITLKEEMDLVRSYIEIEKIRFQDKIDLKWHIDPEGLKVLVPGLILQPLIENALKHGAYQRLDKTEISIDVLKHDTNLEIIIKNDFDPKVSLQKGTSTGLKNTQERLRILFDNQATFKTSQSDSQFVVQITIPT